MIFQHYIKLATQLNIPHTINEKLIHKLETYYSRITYMCIECVIYQRIIVIIQINFNLLQGPRGINV